MTREQWMSLIRAASIIGGTVSTTVGVISPEDWSTISNEALIIGGSIITIAPIIASMFRHSVKGIINAAASLSQVKDVITTKEVADTIPNDKVRSQRGR